METVTDYPYEGLIKFNLKTAGEYEICLRIPAWSSNKWSIMVNGEKVQTEVKDGFAHLKRAWNTGDTISFGT